VIADSVEYMCNAHQVDAMVCISNCDKITPGMLMAAMRLNIPAVFVSGGPMEAGEIDGKYYDLVDAMVMAVDPSRFQKKSGHYGTESLPYLRFLQRYVHRQLHELPGRSHRTGTPRKRNHRGYPCQS
jgi:hypothetical protein